jgi:2-polyprenyl-3-methyl-5-hydroxy-6-metoxy-1,4-benzoquinol methylase
MPNIEDIGKAYENYYTHDAIASNIIPFLRPFEKGYLALRFGYDENVSFFQKMAGLFIYLLPTEKAEIDYSVLYFSKKEIGKLLDIGCGNGSFISRMKNLGWKVEGIDFDSKAVNYCNERGLDVKCGDLAQQNLENDCYDVITINHVIEHVPDAGQLIEECYRILKPGGCLVIATPNTESWIHKTIYKENYFSLDPPRHLFLFNRKNLTTLFKRAGFKPKYVKTTIRNEFYVYAGSKHIKKTGYFKMGQEKLPKSTKLMGKFIQLLGWFIMPFNKDSGGEVVVKAYK